MEDSLIARLEAAINSGNGTAEIIVLSLARLRALARRMLERHAALQRLVDTDDLLQNAAIRMQRALASVVVESPRHAMALAAMQLKRELMDLVRRERRSSVDDTRTQASHDREAVQRDRSLHAWADFHAAVEALPQPQREAVHFLWYLGLPQEEAARLLGITDRTLRRHWTAAQESLRRRLDAEDFASDS